MNPFDMSLRNVLLACMVILLAGCTTLPRLDPSVLIERIENTYANCQSFEDSGSLREIELEAGQTNIAQVTYEIQFVRDRVFRMELHVQRDHGVGPYSLIYYWDGHRWSTYDSIQLYYGWSPVRTNQDSVLGSGVALSSGVFPLMFRLLRVQEDDSSALRIYDRGKVRVERLEGKPVYHLRLWLEAGPFYDLDDYWVDPQTYTILKWRQHRRRNWGDHIEVTTRDALAAPQVNTLSPETVIQFEPPLPNRIRTEHRTGATDSLREKAHVMTSPIGQHDDHTR
ncbi:MAG: hypothetical protein ACK4UN_11470 [Limisphaerales bacterium]